MKYDGNDAFGYPHAIRYIKKYFSILEYLDKIYSQNNFSKGQSTIWKGTISGKSS